MTRPCQGGRRLGVLLLLHLLNQVFPNQYKKTALTLFFDQTKMQFVLSIACKKWRATNWSVLNLDRVSHQILSTHVSHPPPTPTEPLTKLPWKPDSHPPTRFTLQENLQHCLLLTSNFCNFFCPSSMRYMVALCLVLFLPFSPPSRNRKLSLIWKSSTFDYLI